MAVVSDAIAVAPPGNRTRQEQANLESIAQFMLRQFGIRHKEPIHWTKEELIQRVVAQSGGDVSPETAKQVFYFLLVRYELKLSGSYYVRTLDVQTLASKKSP